ncbi:MAG: hypothetical protein JWN25_2396 [Verrucomicrobiales bacterium]|nr:hypothetical protein [Verrucomicrobiales bacterium]MDB6128968.1 hypothetical protein [Verrucomicrobiales bacterium]
MPIRINLLAEAQAAEEMRRRDPVKRAIIVGGILVVLALAYAGFIFARSSQTSTKRKQVEAKWRSMEKEYNAVVANEKELNDQSSKLVALDRLSNSRFLWGSVLNGLQETVIDDIQLVRIKTDQSYTFIEGVKAIVKPGAKTIPAKPAEEVEKVTVIIDAKDFGSASDQNFNKYKTKLLNYPYFKNTFASPDSLRLKSQSQATVDPGDPAHPFSMFTLECNLPEIHRNE